MAEQSEPSAEPGEHVVEPVDASESGDRPRRVSRAGDAVFCNQCGWKNPPDARFCAQCGSRLQVLRTPAYRKKQPAGAGPPERAGSASDAHLRTPLMPEREFRKMGLVIAAGALMLVIVLYTVTAFSKQVFIAEPPITPQERVADGAEGPIRAVPRDVAQQAAALRASADSLEGAGRAARLAEVVNLYLARGFFIEAARAQSEVAATIASTEAWADAGNIAYRAMQEAEGQSKIAYAREAIEAYGRALELAPDNHDVRTDLATAYLATNNPMEGVRQIRQVLDSDPDHLQANFNYGVMLSMIGREDQSIVQFERVLTLAETGSDSYRQAELALRELGAR